MKHLISYNESQNIEEVENICEDVLCHLRDEGLTITIRKNDKILSIEIFKNWSKPSPIRVLGQLYKLWDEFELKIIKPYLNELKSHLSEYDIREMFYDVHGQRANPLLEASIGLCKISILIK